MSIAERRITFVPPSLMSWLSTTLNTGASLTALTVTFIIWESVYSKSWTDTVKVSVPLKSGEAVKVNSLSVWDATIWSPPTMEYVNISSRSGSVADRVNVSDEPSSLNDTFDTLAKTGASFTFETVTVNVWDSVNSPSVTDTVKSSLPFQLSSIILKVTVLPSIIGKILTPSVML